MKSIHIQEFRALVDRYPRILAETHCGAVNVSKQEALEWAEYRTSQFRGELKDTFFYELPPTCLVIGSRPGFEGSIRIETQKEGGGK